METPHEMSIRIVYEDDGLIELETSFATDGWYGWSGRATAYTDRKTVGEFAEKLAHFARGLRGEAAFEAGDESLGYLGLRFYPIDRLGHLACHLRLSPGVPRSHRPEEVTRIAIELYTEPWAVDDFVVGLRQMATTSQGPAALWIE